MNAYPISPDEQARLQELFSYHILNTPIEKEFEDLVQIASMVFQMPVAAITFVDVQRQWTKAQRGLDFCELDRRHSICNHTILQEQILEVNDLQQDNRFKHFPYVASHPFYRYYAGMPLITSKGYKIGVFCLLDTKVHTLSEEQRSTLTALSNQAMRQVELRLRNLQLENLNDKQRLISSRLSHDIKNPLANLKMWMHMQQCGGKPLPAEYNAEVMEMLEQQLNSTLGMLDNMIKWGKLQLKGDNSTVQHVNLRKLADEVIKEAIQACSYKQNVVVNAIPAGVYTQADAEGVRFALRNLLTNADKFTSGGCITISYENKDGRDYIHVADTGVGMTEELTAKLNHNTNEDYALGTSNEKGNGFGLGLVHDYLAEHNGSLRFKSELGKGTKASFTF